MPSPETPVFVESLLRVVGRLTADPDTRVVIRQLAQLVLEATSDSQTSAAAHAPADFAASPLRRARVAAAAARAAATEAPVGSPVFHEEGTAGVSPAPRAASTPEGEPYRFHLGDLTLGRARPAGAEPPRAAAAEKFVPVDFGLIESRCRLKAEGARWAVARRRLLANKADFATEVEPLDRDLIARAKLLPNCFLWLNHPNGPSSNDAARYDEVAACFETLAEAVALVRAIEEDKDRDPVEFEAALNLLAEAQSMLRISVVKFDNYADTDQRDVFQWLKHTANEQQIFIRRFMRLDDPGDPALATDLQNRIKASSGTISEARKKVKQHKKLFSKLKHKCTLIQEQPEAAEEYWHLVIPMIDELVAGGIPPSNRELRESLAPVVDSLPDLPELPRSVQMVLREVDRYLANVTTDEGESAEETPNPVVAEVANLLRGKSLVLIGGERRQQAERALVDAFQLKELHWISTREHESLDWFEPYVAKSDVAVVLLAIRWSSHSYGDVKIFCERHNKPLVRLPGGYNANQVASQIMAQCSSRLQEAS